MTLPCNIFTLDRIRFVRKHLESGIGSFSRVYSPGLQLASFGYAGCLVSYHAGNMLLAGGCSMGAQIADRLAKNNLTNQEPSQNNNLTNQEPSQNEWKTWFHDNRDRFAHLAKENLREDMIKAGLAFTIGLGLLATENLTVLLPDHEVCRIASECHVTEGFLACKKQTG